MSNDCGYEFNNNACASDIYVDVNDGAVLIHDHHRYDPRVGQIRVPVKVGIINVTKALTDTIFIAEGFEEIKHIDRKVFLTQCHVTRKFLYVEGFIIKNIGYATPKPGVEPICHHECNVISNTYNDCTAKINFDFTIPLPEYVLREIDFDINSQLEEASYFGDCTRTCDRGYFGELDCEKFYGKRVALNEPVKGVLESYAFHETVFEQKRCEDTPWRYDTIIEKLELDLEIAIIQTKQLPSMSHHQPCPPPPCQPCPPPQPPYPPCPPPQPPYPPCPPQPPYPPCPPPQPQPLPPCPAPRPCPTCPVPRR